jgi:hypothetical protein
MRRSLHLVALVLMGAGCAHDVQLRMVDGDGTHIDSYRSVEGMSVESGGRQLVMVRESNIDVEELTGRTSVLLYLSFPVQAGQGIDLLHPQVYLVWSDLAAEFSGFLNATSFQRIQEREVQSVSGSFSGKVRSRTGESLPRDVRVTLNKVPLRPAESPSAIDRRMYSEMLREHLHNLESSVANPEDGPSATTPGAIDNP